MTTQARKVRGREAETLFARWLQLNGWVYAEPVGAGRQGSDITGVPGLLIEVKATGELRLQEALRQARSAVRDGGGGEVPFVVWRPPMGGPSNVDLWPAFMRAGELIRVLHMAGFGDVKEIVR
jgi:hypothetical protein